VINQTFVLLPSVSVPKAFGITATLIVSGNFMTNIMEKENFYIIILNRFFRSSNEENDYHIERIDEYQGIV
jgi:hypothetical protein